MAGDIESLFVGSKVTISSCEKMLADIEAKGEFLPLRLPLTAKYLMLGGESAYVQAIVTWAQKKGDRVLEVHSQKAGASSISENLFGLVAVLCSDQIRDDNESAQAYADVARKRLQILQGADPADSFKGLEIEIICADHKGAEHPSSLYQKLGNGDFDIRDRPDMVSVARSILDLITGGNKLGYDAKGQPWSTSAAEPIGNMLYELFRNTIEHAKYDSKGNVLRKSVRGVQARCISLTKQEYLKIAHDSPPLFRFIEGFSTRDAITQKGEPFRTHRIPIFELSIFDSGPGFACTITKKQLENLTLTEELTAVNACFASMSSKPHAGYGKGLPYVVELLGKLNGFLRLRTGRLSLFHDFSDGPVEGPLKLERWSSATENFDPSVSGALITLLIPMWPKYEWVNK